MFDLAALGYTVPPRLTGQLAITNVTVVPMDSDRLLEGQTVVVQDGRIQRVAAADGCDAGAMPCLDGTGKFLMPGLADMHVHFEDAGEFVAYLANGITLVRNMTGKPFHLEWQRHVERGDLPGPTVVTTSPIIDGLGDEGKTAWPGSQALDDPAQAASMVEDYARLGYRQIKTYQWLRRDCLRAVCEASRAAGLRVTGHCPEGLTFEEAIGIGMSCFEHLTGVFAGHLRDGAKLPLGRGALTRGGTPEALRLMGSAVDMRSIAELAKRLAAGQIWNCPTAVVWQQATDGSMSSVAQALPYEKPPLVETWRTSAASGRYRQFEWPRDDWLHLLRERNKRYLEIVAILHREGAPLLLGTDTPNPYVTHGFSIHQELRNLVAAGLTPFDALRCGTVDAARFMGEAGQWGVIAEGARADLLMVGENPLRNLATLESPEAVLTNGFLLTRADLQSLLERRANLVAS